MIQLTGSSGRRARAHGRFGSRLLWSSVLVMTLGRSLSAQTPYYTTISGPVSRVYPTIGSSNYNQTWFPDAHFPLMWGGLNSPDVNLSWWMERREGASLDDTIKTAGAQWIPSGALGSGDYRGYWITSVFRPSDYKSSLLGTTVNLTIYSTDNSTSATESHVIDHDYLVGFAHCEDYDGNWNVLNRSRTLYSYDNGLTWKKGPWDTPMLVLVDTRTTPGTTRYVSVGKTSMSYTTNLATGTGWTSAPISFSPTNFAFSNSLFYNRYLNKWMLWYGQWGSTSNVFSTAVSSDLLTWSIGSESVVMNCSTPASAKGVGNYPTMIGSLPATASGFNYDTDGGQLVWLYNNIGGLGGRALHFIKQPLQSLNWTGGAGNQNLDAIGNWTVSGGGAFIGFVDEKQGLDFASGSGALVNTLPVTTRLRHLRFLSGAGSYVIGGNPIQLEASSISSALVSISNSSSNTQTINADIDARSAALYLRAYSGPISVNGDIDMRGNGGIVVYGAFNTTINGAISNSGYRDFESGLEEFIGDSNAGRLVKEDSSTLYLGGDNTFSGRTDILGGVIHVTHDNALKNSVVTFATDNALVLGANAWLGGLNGSGNLWIGGYNLTLGNSNPASNYSTRYSGVISGSGSLTMDGSNVQRISGSNSYTGGTNLVGGVLEVPANTNTALGSGTISFNGGTLKALGPVILNNSVVVASASVIDTNGNPVTFAGAVSGPGQLMTQGAGLVSFTGSNSSSGDFIIKNTVEVSGNGALGSGLIKLDGGLLKLTGNVDLGAQQIWVLSPGSAIDTGAYTLATSGALSVPSNQIFLKKGAGTLVWSGSGTAVDGDFIIDGGAVTSTRNGTVTFTNGSVTLNGSKLNLQPVGTSGDVVVNLAQTVGKKLNINGSGSLTLNRGANNNLQVFIGNPSNPNALNKGAASSFLMTPASGTAALGSSPGVKVFVSGTADTAEGAIYSPSVLVTSGVDGQGDFTKYVTTTGFSGFSGYTSRSGSYSQPNTATAEIANITAAATLSANSYVQALRVSGTNTLNLNAKTYTITGLTGEAGVILNGGTLTGGTLAFGANRGYIYTGGTTASIGSVITGTGGLTIFGGPGTSIALSASNTHGGGTVINGAKAVVSTWGLGNTATWPVTLDGQGTVQFTASLTSGRQFIMGSGGGSIEMPGSLQLTLGTPVTGTGDWRKLGAGTVQLKGANTYTGSVFVDAGTLIFDGASTLQSTGGSIITVANGARAVVWSWDNSNAINTRFVISGSGVSGGGALECGQNPKLAGAITLAGDAKIGGSAASAGNITGFIAGSGKNLELGAPAAGAPIKVSGGMGLGAGSLTVTGAGGALINTNIVASYTGGTTVASGSLLTIKGEINGTSGVAVNGTLAGTGSLTTAGTVTVSSGAMVLAGSGTTPGMLSVNGDLALGAGSEYQSYVNGAGVSIAGSTGYGQLVVIGNGVLDGTLRLYRNSSYTPTAGEELFVVLRNGGSGAFNQVVVMDGGVPTTFSGAPGTLITIGGVQGTLIYNASSSQALTNGSKDVRIKF